MAYKKIVIAGAGLTGLSLAWHLHRRGQDPVVFEKEARVGGLCRSRRVGGFVFDAGGHVFHFKDPSTGALVKHLLGRRLTRYKREALFYAFGRYSPYPFQVHFRQMPDDVVEECLAGVRDALKKKRPGDAEGFVAWARETFGRGIARHFLIPYNAKFWAVPLRTLTSAWAKDVIPAAPLREIISGAGRPEKKAWGYNHIFWYPQAGGVEELPRVLAAPLRRVFTHCAIRAVDFKKREVRLASGAREAYDTLVLTIPLPELLSLMTELPRAVEAALRRLKWNSILNLNLGIEGRPPRFCHWIYFPERDVSFFRAGFPLGRSVSKARRPRHAVSLEVAYRPGRPPHPGQLRKKILRDLAAAGLLPAGKAVSFMDTQDIVYGYPVYDRAYASARQTVLSFLARHGIIGAGRYGAWRYASMEDVLREGRELAGRLHHGG
ncbi:MAG: FAD-dependent oxidoreductase [Candidatus Omnitrophica bacterium]|nr:FAD-dependent oxidoreductase [Candidatus Omnitrophota bacterium]MDD5573553.1 FAD-dependent oxidoreductase [Candidatus Omnitrophota bacterium]